VIVTLYLGTTGTLIQLVDLRSLLGHAPATDVNMEALREGGNGPGAFQVISDPDYSAAVLPSDLKLETSFAKVLNTASKVAGNAALGYVEMRMIDGKPVGQIKADRQLLRFDAVTGDAIPGSFAETKINQSPDSLRNTVKRLHRMTAIGNWTLWINVVAGTALLVLIVTGLWMYFQLYSARARVRAHPTGLFWSAGGRWRSLHRWISLCAAVFLLVVALSGTWLAVESLGFGIYMASHPPRPRAVSAPRTPLPDGITALNEAVIPAMLSTTLASFKTSMPNTSMRVLRLRVYGDRGGIEWDGERPNHLRLTRYRQPPLTLTRGGFEIGSAASRVTRMPAGLPEGYLECFANIYLDAAELVRAAKEGRSADPAAMLVPQVEAGIDAVRFVDAVIASGKSNTWVDLDG